MQTAGNELGANHIPVTLLIPDRPLSGPEIENDGILVLGEHCDHVLNAFIAEETRTYLIDAAKDYPLIHMPSHSHVANADFAIWNFEDGSGEARFFVTGVLALRPAMKAPSFSDAKFFQLGQASTNRP